MSLVEKRWTACVEGYRAASQTALQAGDDVLASKYAAWADMVSAAPWKPSREVSVGKPVEPIKPSKRRHRDRAIA